MRLSKTIMALCSALLLAGCTNSNQGAALTVENAASYIDLGRMSDNELNANFTGTTITFSLYPNPAKGKLFSSDIKGKCKVSVKNCKGINADFTFDFDDPFEVSDVEFRFVAGKEEDGYKTMDYLEGSFANTASYQLKGVCVYNVRITEISGHMLP
jgi:hypothetical protein